MFIDQIKPDNIEIGLTIIEPSSILTIVASFEDDGTTFYVAKKWERYGAYSYSHIYYFDSEGNFQKHI